MRSLLARAIFIAAVSVPALAQNHPNFARGFDPERPFQAGEIDNVNLFNGNLVVTIPVGQAYHVGGNLSYGFTLVYNGQAWSWRKMPSGSGQSGTNRFAVPTSTSNVALGWQLTLGELIAPKYRPRIGEEEPNSDEYVDEWWSFITPDGAKHGFRPWLHPEDAPTPPAAPSAAQYTSDGTYIRLRNGGAMAVGVADDEKTLFAWRQLVEMPNGVVYTFRSQRITSGTPPSAPFDDSRYFLDSIHDAFGNRVDLQYCSWDPIRKQTVCEKRSSQEAEEIRVVEMPKGDIQTRRTQKILLRKLQWHVQWQTYSKFVVTGVELTVKGGTAKYEFVTDFVPVMQPGGSDRYSGDTTVHQSRVLSAVKMPDATEYSFNYFTPGGGEGVDHHLRQIALPTGGTIKYRVGSRSFPQADGPDFYQTSSWPENWTPTWASTAVTAREVSDGTTTREWRYGSCLRRPAAADDIQNWEKWQEMVVAVDNPDGGRTLHYFNVDLRGGDDPKTRSTPYEYGLPYTREPGMAWPAGDYFLSTEEIAPGCSANACEGFPCRDRVVRQTYVKYEIDGYHPGFTGMGRGDEPILKRQIGTITATNRFVPESGKWTQDFCGAQRCHTQVESNDFDGLGHHRQKIESTNIGGTVAKRVTKTNYDALANVDGHQPATYYSHAVTDTANPAPLPANVPADYLPAGSPWLLDFYDSNSIGEFNASATQKQIADCFSAPDMCTAGTVRKTAEFQWNPTTRFLERSRTIRGKDPVTGAVLPDEVSIFEVDDAGRGNVKTETHFLTAAATATSAATPPADAAQRVRIHHEYEYGVLARSKYDGLVESFYAPNLTIDPNTGLPASSKDPQGRVTRYDYDVMGRLRLVDPPAQASTVYEYDLASRPVKVIEKRFADEESAPLTPSRAPLAESRHYYDGLGRLTQQKRRMLGGQWSANARAYDVMGRTQYETTAEYETNGDYSGTFTAAMVNAHKVTSYTYDPLGRVTKVTEPDHSETETQYAGARETARTVSVAADKDSPTQRDKEQKFTTRELYDGFGRLTAIVEPLAYAETEHNTTHYSYDFADRLTGVSATAPGNTTQTRTFEYDLSGLLLREDHPESEPVVYSYGPRRRMLTRKTGNEPALTFDYDSAERLRKVSSGAKTLKELIYDLDPETGIRELGSLVRQKRHNHLPDGTHIVTDSFRYDAAGRISQKDTEFRKGTSLIAAFTQPYDYTDLGAPQSFQYPTCASCFGLDGRSRRVGLQYEQGLLTAIDRVTMPLTARENDPAISYTAAGAIHELRHRTQFDKPGVLEVFEPDPSGMPRVKSIAFYGALDCGYITAQSPDVLLSNNVAANSATFTVSLSAAAAAHGRIEWFKGQRGDTSQPVIANGATVTTSVADEKATLVVAQLPETTQYWCRVTLTDGGCESRSRTFTAAMCQTPVITAPEEATRTAVDTKGRIVSFSADADGPGLRRFVWVRRSNNAPDEIIGTGAALQYQLVAGLYRIVLIAESACGSVERVVADLDVSDKPCAAAFDGLPPYLPPKVVVLSPGLSQRISVSLKEAAPGARYWFRWSENGRVANEYSSETPSTTRTIVVRDEDKVIRLESWVTCGQSTSPPVFAQTYATVYGRCTPPAVDVTPQWAAYKPGERITLTANPSRLDVTYQWYRGESGNTSYPIGGATSRELVVDPQLGTYWVRITIDGEDRGQKFPCAKTADSPTVVIDGASCAAIRILEEPQDTETKAGVPATLTVQAMSDPPVTSYRWEDRNGPIAGSAGETFRPAPIRTTDYSATVFRKEYPELGCKHIHARSRFARVHVTSCADITIADPLRDVSIVEGETARLSISATAFAPLRYQWYRGESGDTSSPVAGANGPVLEQSDPSPKYWVRLSFDDPNKCAIDSRTATVSVCRTPRLRGGAEPGNPISTVPGQSQLLLVDIEGTGFRYEWFQGTLGDESRRLASTSDIQQVSPDVTTAYWVRVSSDCNRILQRQITVSVCPPIVAGPTAAARRVVRGATTTLSVDAPAADRIEWYSRPRDTDVKPVLFASGTAAAMRTVTTPKLNENTEFWARAYSGACFHDSTYAYVDVCNELAVQWDPATATKVAQGAQHTYSVQASWLIAPGSADALAYAFYEGATAGNIAASVLLPTQSNVLPLTFPEAKTRYLWARVTNVASGCYVDTPVLAVSVCVPTITASPQGGMVDKTKAGTSVPLTVTATPASGLTYQWYTGASGQTANAVSGATAATYPASPDTDTSYWVRVTGCGVSRDSAAALVTACYAPAITQQPASALTLTSGSSSALTVKASGKNLSFQWFKGPAGDPSSVALPANAWTSTATSSTLPVSGSETADYWVRVSGACGSPADSNGSKVSVAPKITVQPSGGYVMPGGTLQLDVTATGNQRRYEWYAAGTAPQLLSAQAVSAYTPPAHNASRTYFCRVYSGNASADSEPATIQLCPSTTLTWPASTDTEARPAQAQTLSINGIAAGTATTKKWYEGATGNTAKLLGTGDTLAIQPSATTSYWVRVTTTATGCWADSPTLTVRVCDPRITSQPLATSVLDKTVNSSANVKLQVAADAGPHTYQWYIGNPGSGTAISGATADTYYASPAADTTYWARVTSSCGLTADSTAATVIVCKPPAIQQQPMSQTITAGTKVPLTVSVSGTEVTLQWYRGVVGDTSNPLGTSATIDVVPTVTTHYWVRATGRCGRADSVNATLSVPPKITQQPAGGPVTRGTSRTLTALAEGTDPVYQWYAMINNSGQALTTPSLTGNSYVTGPINSDSTYFCRVYSGNAYADTQMAAFTVCQPRAITYSGTGVSGSTHTLSIVNPEAGETFDWYALTSGGSSAYIGAGTSINVAPDVTTGYWARTKRAQCDADSAPVTVAICYPRIGTQPQGTTISSGGTHTLSVAAVGTQPLTFQWYIGAANDTFQPIAGQTGTSYTTPALSATTNYWVRISSPLTAGCAASSTASATATVTVCNKPSVTQQPQSVNLNAGASTNLTVTASGDGLHYEWYEGAAGVTTKRIGTDSRTLLVTGDGTKSVWVRVTGTCGFADSNAVLVSVYPKFTIQPADTALCYGETASFSVYVTGASSIAWQRFTGSAWQTVGTGTSLGITITSFPTYIRAVAQSGNAVTYSRDATVSIDGSRCQ